MECVKNIEVKGSGCMKKCEGLQVTSYDSFKPDPQIQKLSDELLREYNVFKGIANNLGKFIHKSGIKHFSQFSEDDELAKMKYVKIYFQETQTFDKITKDRAEKFVDQLSAIGGTLGLLTGFSIISGIEIVYFLIRIISNIFQRKNTINKF